MADQNTISGDKLAVLTGLTDRRHRQLAKEGWFPPPVRGNYQLIPTLRGMFKYYQEHADRTDFGKRKKEEEVRKLKLANDEKESILIKKAVVMESIAAISAKWKSILLKYSNDAPVLFSGKDTAEIRGKARAAFDALLEDVRNCSKLWKC